MTISYPRSFPSGIDKFKQVTFDLSRQEGYNILGSGAVQSAEIGEPLWTAKYTTIDLTPAQRGAWAAWRDSLRGAGKSFYGYNPDAPSPLAYIGGSLPAHRYDGSTPFDGTCALNTWSGGNVITLGNLPNGYMVKPGDMIGWILSGKYALHRALEDVAANSSGVVSFAVEPFPRGTAPVSPIAANLVKPVCVMRIVRQTWSSDVSGYTSPVSFQAAQDLS